MDVICFNFAFPQFNLYALAIKKKVSIFHNDFLGLILVCHSFLIFITIEINHSQCAEKNAKLCV